MARSPFAGGTTMWRWFATPPPAAAVTHWDSRCVWSAVFVNLAIASLLWGIPPDDALRLVERAERARETLGDALVPFGIDAPVPAAVTKALDAAEMAPEEIGLDGWDMGYTLKAMQVALWCAPGHGLRGGAGRRRQCRRGHRHQRRGGGCGAWCAVRIRRDSETLVRPGCRVAGRPGCDGGMGRPSDGLKLQWFAFGGWFIVTSDNRGLVCLSFGHPSASEVSTSLAVTHPKILDQELVQELAQAGKNVAAIALACNAAIPCSGKSPCSAISDLTIPIYQGSNGR